LNPKTSIKSRSGKVFFLFANMVSSKEFHLLSSRSQNKSGSDFKSPILV
jgi:hypothetical protein